MPGPFGQPQGVVDLGLDIGAGYQQNAADKIAQARVKQRKDYTSGYAKKYGVTDAATATKGLSDTDIYEMAQKLVEKRRGPATAPGQTKAPGTTPAKKPAAKKPAIKSPAKRGIASSPVARKRTTTRKKPAARRPQTNPKAAAGTRRVTTAIQQAREAAAGARGYDY